MTTLLKIEKVENDKDTTETANQLKRPNKCTKKTSKSNKENNGKIIILEAHFASENRVSGCLEPIRKKASDKGHFGWTNFSEAYIPYIFRKSEKYCAVRMIDYILKETYYCWLDLKIFDCVSVPQYNVTETECRLLNEINITHSDQQFGYRNFTLTDQIIHLNDAIEFHKFLEFCYNKLTITDYSGKSGFIRIAKSSVIPYIIEDTEKFIPAYYLFGEVQKLPSHEITGWDFSYLKFCFEIQGTAKIFKKQFSISVISLKEVQKCFPIGTEFEEYWNSDSTEMFVLPKGNQQIPIWTKSVHNVISLQVNQENRSTVLCDSTRNEQPQSPREQENVLQPTSHYSVPHPPIRSLPPWHTKHQNQSSLLCYSTENQQPQILRTQANIFQPTSYYYVPHPPIPSFPPYHIQHTTNTMIQTQETSQRPPSQYVIQPTTALLTYWMATPRQMQIPLTYQAMQNNLLVTENQTPQIVCTNQKQQIVPLKTSQTTPTIISNLQVRSLYPMISQNPILSAECSVPVGNFGELNSLNNISNQNTDFKEQYKIRKNES